MTQQQRQRVIHAVVCAFSLAAIVALTVHQTGPHSGGRMVSQMLWMRGVGGGGVGANGSWAGLLDSNDTEVSSVTTKWPSSPSPSTSPRRASVARFDPFGELGSGAAVSNADYPNLYRSLTRLAQPPAALFPGPVAGSPQQCKRPASKSLSGLLSQPPAGYPYTRPPRPGGLWSPGCWPPLSRTAVLVPYRNRSKNLDILVPYMQTLLQQQGIFFGIFVIEQANAKLFNRAKLLNIGFKVSQQFGQFDCYVFQDADKVPENVANLYHCDRAPKLMMSEMLKSGGVKRGKFYHNFFGASVALSREMFQRVNGNSNRYYGWGREDDELAARLSLRGYRIYYPTSPEERFVNMDHTHDIVSNSMPWPYAHKVHGTMDKDGLNSLSYGDKGIYVHDLFILIRADV